MPCFRFWLLFHLSTTNIKDSMIPTNIVNLCYVFDPGDLERSKFKIPLPTIFAPLWVLTLCQVWFKLVENCKRSSNLSELSIFAIFDDVFRRVSTYWPVARKPEVVVQIGLDRN